MRLDKAALDKAALVAKQNQALQMTAAKARADADAVASKKRQADAVSPPKAQPMPPLKIDPAPPIKAQPPLPLKTDPPPPLKTQTPLPPKIEPVSPPKTQPPLPPKTNPAPFPKTQALPLTKIEQKTDPRADYNRLLESAASLERAKKNTEAIATYRKAWRLIPQDAAALAALRRLEVPLQLTVGKQALATRRFTEASQAFEAVLQVSPDNAEAKAGVQKARKGETK